MLHLWTASAWILSRPIRVWAKIRVFPVWAGSPVIAVSLCTGINTSSPLYGSEDRQFLPSSSGIGFDRRDADHRRACGRGTIRKRSAGRARLSGGTDKQAARPRIGLDRG